MSEKLTPAQLKQRAARLQAAAQQPGAVLIRRFAFKPLPYAMASAGMFGVWILHRGTMRAPGIVETTEQIRRGKHAKT